MRLLAISDLHLRHQQNRELLLDMPSFNNDWLIVAGDVGHSVEDLQMALTQLTQRFAKVFWVPGNHELWTTSNDDALRGEQKYLRLLDVCERLGVVHPETPYVTWPGHPQATKIVPMFLLYDYSFSPIGSSPAQAIQWAADARTVCADEYYLFPEPHQTRQDWCAARCHQTEQRLINECSDTPTILINHWPLCEDLAILPKIPRFKVWCGTRKTEKWPERFNAQVVIYGHLHIRRTHYRGTIRFEEVSLGYPRQYQPQLGIAAYLREILPG